MTCPVEIAPGLLVVFYDHNGEKWVEIASNYNLNCPLTPGMQRHIGNVFMPAKEFLKILNSAELRALVGQ